MQRQTRAQLEYVVENVLNIHPSSFCHLRFTFSLFPGFFVSTQYIFTFSMIHFYVYWIKIMLLAVVLSRYFFRLMTFAQLDFPFQIQARGIKV